VCSVQIFQHLPESDNEGLGQGRHLGGVVDWGGGCGTPRNCEVKVLLNSDVYNESAVYKIQQNLVISIFC